MEQASVKKDEIRRALDVVMATSIVPVVLGVALIYAIFCVAHLLVLPPGRAEIMASLAGGSALVCGVMYWAMLRWELPPRLAHPSGFVVALIMLGNTLTHLYLEGDPLETTNLLLVILGVSCVFLSPAWAGAVGGLAVGGWSLIALNASADPGWGHFGFALMTTMAIGATVLLGRRRSLVRVEEMRLVDRQRQEQLAQALQEAQQAQHELQEANNDLARARDAAEEANRAKSIFLANMSHEIRTPLNAVVGLTDLVLDTRLEKEPRSHLETARESALSLLGLLGDILDFSKIEAGQLQLENSAFDLRPLLRQVVGTFGPQAVAKSIALDLRVEEGVADKLVGDPGRLRQVLVNLLSNAVKFTEKGQVCLEVAPVEGPDAGRLRFAVEDTGIGIDAAKQEDIFGAFVQADGSTTRLYGGTGLGLAISRQLVQLMGGEIELESRPGTGSRFSFAIAFSVGAPIEAAAAEKAAPAPAVAPLRVLLAEDNVVNQLVARAQLEKMGHAVRVVADGQEALSALEENEIDLVLMDLQMPRMDGYQAAAAIRKRPGPRIPIIALTAHARREDEEECRRSGMDGYLTKPLRPEKLVHAISEATAG